MQRAFLIVLPFFGIASALLVDQHDSRKPSFGSVELPISKHQDSKKTGIEDLLVLPDELTKGAKKPGIEDLLVLPDELTGKSPRPSDFVVKKKEGLIRDFDKLNSRSKDLVNYVKSRDRTLHFVAQISNTVYGVKERVNHLLHVVFAVCPNQNHGCLPEQLKDFKLYEIGKVYSKYQRNTPTLYRPVEPTNK